jgi:hypothetical protein
LSEAFLWETDLSLADLNRARLIRAQLNGANLSSANLSGANLTGAQFANADLTNAIYAPASEPLYPYVAGIKGLATVRVPPGEEIGLVQLRKLLQNAGLRDLERETTYTIERVRTSERRGLPSVFAAVF